MKRTDGNFDRNGEHPSARQDQTPCPPQTCSPPFPSREGCGGPTAAMLVFPAHRRGENQITICMDNRWRSLKNDGELFCQPGMNAACGLHQFASWSHSASRCQLLATLSQEPHPAMNPRISPFRGITRAGVPVPASLPPASERHRHAVSPMCNAVSGIRNAAFAMRNVTFAMRYATSHMCYATSAMCNAPSPMRYAASAMCKAAPGMCYAISAMCFAALHMCFAALHMCKAASPMCKMGTKPRFWPENGLFHPKPNRPEP